MAASGARRRRERRGDLHAIERMFGGQDLRKALPYMCTPLHTWPSSPRSCSARRPRLHSHLQHSSVMWAGAADWAAQGGVSFCRPAHVRKTIWISLSLKKGPGLHRTPARNGLTKRLKRSVLLLLRGLLGGLLGRLLRSLLLCHHALPPSPEDMDPIGSIGLAGSM